MLMDWHATHAQECLARVLNAAQEPVFCTLRTRKRCEVLRCRMACCPCAQLLCTTLPVECCMPLRS